MSTATRRHPAGVALLCVLVTLGCGPRARGTPGGKGITGPAARVSRGHIALPTKRGDGPGGTLVLLAEPDLDVHDLVAGLRKADAAGYRRFRLLVAGMTADGAPEFEFAVLREDGGGGPDASEPESIPTPDPVPDSVLAGPRDVASLAGVVSSARAAVHACYERALSRSPWLAGRMVLRLSIAAGGEVSAVRVVESALDEAGFETCVVAVLRELRFPAGETDDAVDVPFDFEPSGHERVPVVVVVGKSAIAATDPMGVEHSAHAKDRPLTFEELLAVLRAATDVPLPPPRVDVLPREGLPVAMFDRLLRELAGRVRMVRIALPD